MIFSRITEIETLWCKSADWLPPLGKLPNYANCRDHSIISHVSKSWCRKHKTTMTMKKLNCATTKNKFKIIWCGHPHDFTIHRPLFSIFKPIPHLSHYQFHSLAGLNAMDMSLTCLNWKIYLPGRDFNNFIRTLFGKSFILIAPWN